MSTRVVVDPVTRIEGHLRIDVEVDGGKVQDAWSSGTMFRGITLPASLHAFTIPTHRKHRGGGALLAGAMSCTVGRATRAARMRSPSGLRTCASW